MGQQGSTGRYGRIVRRPKLVSACRLGGPSPLTLLQTDLQGSNHWDTHLFNGDYYANQHPSWKLVCVPGFPGESRGPVAPVNLAPGFRRGDATENRMENRGHTPVSRLSPCEPPGLKPPRRSMLEDPSKWLGPERRGCGGCMSEPGTHDNFPPRVPCVRIRQNGAARSDGEIGSPVAGAQAVCSPPGGRGRHGGGLSHCHHRAG
jgi:hypothetical protein